jgi:hypothetical protein
MFEKYISELKGLNETTLGKIARTCLEYIAEEKELNVYQAKNMMDKDEKDIAYKNVHANFQKLKELRLIKLLRRDAKAHAATYYGITDRGWVYLITNSPFLLNNHSQSHPRKWRFPDTFRRSELFHSLLASYFEESTIEQIKSLEFNLRLYRYVVEACRVLVENANSQLGHGPDTLLISIEIGVNSSARKLLRDLLGLGMGIEPDSKADKELLDDWKLIKADSKFVKLVDEEEQNTKTLIRNFRR